MMTECQSGTAAVVEVTATAPIMEVASGSKSDTPSTNVTADLDSSLSTHQSVKRKIESESLSDENISDQKKNKRSSSHPTPSTSRPTSNEVLLIDLMSDNEDSDCSNHTAELCHQSESDSSEDASSVIPVLSRKKKSKPTQARGSKQMTSCSNMTSSEQSSNSTSQSAVPVASFPTYDDAIWGQHCLSTATLPDFNAQLPSVLQPAPSSGATAQRRTGPSQPSRSKTRKNNSHTVPSTFCEFPVIIEDKKANTSCTLKGLLWKLSDMLQSALNSPVRSTRQIASCKFIIGCSSQKQQMKLVSLHSLSGIEISCSIPRPTTQGVISGIPVSISNSEVMAKFDYALDSAGHIIPLKVKDAFRLRNQDGSPSLAFRLTFEATSLPDVVKINRTEYYVEPYSPRPVRCFKCQRLGHGAKDCIAKQPSCSSCGTRGHTAATCQTTKRHCINCKGEHSAAYLGCPAIKSHTLANRIRAQNYMPKATAFQKAKQIICEKRSSRQEPPQIPGWRTDTAEMPKSYANIAAANTAAAYTAAANNAAANTAAAAANNAATNTAASAAVAYTAAANNAAANAAANTAAAKMASVRVQASSNTNSTASKVSLAEKNINPVLSTPKPFPTSSNFSSSVVETHKLSEQPHSEVENSLRTENENLKNQVLRLQKAYDDMRESIISLSEEIRKLHQQQTPAPSISTCTSVPNVSMSTPPPSSWVSFLQPMIEDAVRRVLQSLPTSNGSPLPHNG